MLLDLTLDRIGIFHKDVESGLAEVLRWRKEFRRKNPENALQHTLKASLLALEVVCVLLNEKVINHEEALTIVASTILHDIGEIGPGDTLYSEKSPRKDLKEIDCFFDKVMGFPEKQKNFFLYWYLFQFSFPDSGMSEIRDAPNDFARRVLEIRENNRQELFMIFEFIEKYGYILYAYAEYRLDPDEEKYLINLVQVLRNQAKRLGEIVAEIKVLEDFFYSKKLQEKIYIFLKDFEGRYVE